MRYRHDCGHRLYTRAYWNGLENIITFWDDDVRSPTEGQEVINCPGCGEALFSSDIGTTILSEEQWAQKEEA